MPFMTASSAASPIYKCAAETIAIIGGDHGLPCTSPCVICPVTLSQY
jgi:hypothetical protein